MNPKTEQHTGFSGTYFDKNSVVRLSWGLSILGWVIFAIYLVQWVFNIWQSVYGAIVGGYMMDFGFIIFNLSQPFQGAMVLGILLAASKALLILLDIEDNTRRAARHAEKK